MLLYSCQYIPHKQIRHNYVQWYFYALDYNIIQKEKAVLSSYAVTMTARETVLFY